MNASSWIGRSRTSVGSPWCRPRLRLSSGVGLLFFRGMHASIFRHKSGEESRTLSEGAGR